MAKPEAPLWDLGADDKHVWFVDGNLDASSRAQLQMWDGERVRAVASTPRTTMFGGGRDSVWLAGDQSLLRLRAAAGSNVR